MKKSKFDISEFDKVELSKQEINEVIKLGKQKKYREIINKKTVYRWIEELGLHFEIGEISPQKDEAL